MHGFGGRSVAPRTRRGEKRAPLRNAREPSRYRAWANTQNRRKVSRSSTRNSHTLPLKSPPGPLFRPIACQNAVRVATARRAPNEISHKRRNRAKRARRGGAGTPGTPQPRAPGHPAPPEHPLYCINNDVLTEPGALTRIKSNPQAHHAGPPGAADFPCLRQLPPPPFKKR